MTVNGPATPDLPVRNVSQLLTWCCLWSYRSHRARAFAMPNARAAALATVDRRWAHGRDLLAHRRDRRPRARRRHGRAGGLHPPDPVRRRARDHPAAAARPDPGPDDARRHLRPADRRRVRQPAGVLVGRQPGRRLAAPVPRRRRQRLAGPARDRGAQPRRHGQPLRRRRLRPAVRRDARLRRHRPRRPDGQHRADRLPVHRRVADRRAGAAPGRHDHPRAARRPGRQRADVGHHRRAEGGRARRAAIDRHGRGDRRRAAAAAAARSCCRPGRSPGSRSRRAAPTRRTRTGSPSATTTSTVAWDAISRDRDTFTAWIDADTCWRA